MQTLQQITDEELKRTFCTDLEMCLEGRDRSERIILSEDMNAKVGDDRIRELRVHGVCHE